MDFAQLAPSPTDPSDAVPVRKLQSTEPLLAGAALVVEDNIIIALDAEEMLQELGAERVETAASVREALRLIQESTPNFALLDLNLGSESSLPVAERLRELNVPVIFATGYGDNHNLPPSLRGIPVIDKPFTLATLRAALASLPGSGMPA
jgi:CheY-like chemotaxis protein